MSTQTLETVLKGYVVAVAAQNHWLRQHIATEVQDADQFKNMVENAIKQDIANAKNQLPNFLKNLDVPAEVEAELHDLHLKSFFSALETDAELGLRNISAHFGLARTSTAHAPALAVMDGGKAAEAPAAPTPPAPPTPPEAQ